MRRKKRVLIMTLFVSFAVRVAVVAFALAAAAFDSVVFALMPEVTIAVYAVFVWRAFHLNPSRLAASAEQVYFLGYLSTLAAFVGLLFPIIQARAIPDEPGGVLLMIAVALGATVTGLIAMTTLRDLADTSVSPSSPAVAVAGRPASVAADLEASGRCVIAAHRELASLIADIGGEVRHFKTALGQLRAEASAGSEGAETFSVAVRELQQVMRGYVTLVRTVLEDAATGTLPDTESEEGKERIQ